MNNVAAGRILFIDDSFTVQKALGTELEAIGYEVFSAYTGEEGIEKARVLRPDCIILDIELPGMSGDQVCRELKSDHELMHTPVLVLTVHASSEYLISLMEAGADDFAGKGEDIKVITTRLMGLLRMRAMNDELFKQKMAYNQAGETRIAFEELKASKATIADLHKKLSKTLKEKGTLLYEMHHRVKNNMQVMSSLLRLQARKSDNPEFLEAVRDSEERVKAMTLLHESLYLGGDFSKVDMNKYITELTWQASMVYDVHYGRVSKTVDVEGVFLNLDTAVPCGMIVNELYSNALKHAFPDGMEGEIRISMSMVGENEYELAVSDNGIGFPEDFDVDKADTIGMMLVRQLVEGQLDGTIVIERDGGTEARVSFRRKMPMNQMQ